MRGDKVAACVGGDSGHAKQFGCGAETWACRATPVGIRNLRCLPTCPAGAVVTADIDPDGLAGQATAESLLVGERHLSPRSVLGRVADRWSSHRWKACRET